MIHANTLSKNIVLGTIVSGKNDRRRRRENLDDENDRRRLDGLLGRLEGRYHVSVADSCVRSSK